MANPKFYLDRDHRTDVVTLGRLYSDKNDFGFDLGDGQHGLHTLELPWKENQKRISCIPPDNYIAVRSMYYSGDGVGGKRDYPCFELLDVPDRTEIKIHIGNYLKNFLGCIGLGKKRDTAVPAVWSSGEAFNLFMQYLDEIDKIEIEIRNV